jgi:hypothetical protein
VRHVHIRRNGPGQPFGIEYLDVRHRGPPMVLTRLLGAFGTTLVPNFAEPRVNQLL